MNRLAVAAFNTAQASLDASEQFRQDTRALGKQGVPQPSTMVTEMLNRLGTDWTISWHLALSLLREVLPDSARHLPKLATAAKSLLLQIPEAVAQLV